MKTAICSTCKRYLSRNRNYLQHTKPIRFRDHDGANSCREVLSRIFHGANRSRNSHDQSNLRLEHFGHGFREWREARSRQTPPRHSRFLPQSRLEFRRNVLSDAEQQMRLQSRGKRSTGQLKRPTLPSRKVGKAYSYFLRLLVTVSTQRRPAASHEL